MIAWRHTLWFKRCHKIRAILFCPHVGPPLWYLSG